MMLLITSVALFSSAMSILFAEGPLTLGLWLIMMTLMTSCFMTMITTKWFGIILFLIYVGGLLVMFSYFSAISPNQLTDIKTMLYTSTLFMATSSLLLSQKLTPSNKSLSSNNLNMDQNSILASSNLIPILAAATILFLTMIVVVKIAPKHYGPLRPFK